jgi:hypothetical protein
MVSWKRKLSWVTIPNCEERESRVRSRRSRPSRVTRPEVGS